MVLLRWAGGLAMLALGCLIGSVAGGSLLVLGRVDLRDPLRICAVGGFVIAAVLVGKAIANRDVIRRTRSDRAVRASQPPAAERPATAPPVRAAHIPELSVRRLRPPRLTWEPQLVSDRTNVAGRPPVDIVYLRLFENEAGSRTFMHGAWREFGQVSLLRTSESLTRAEMDSVEGLLVASPTELEQVVYRPRPSALEPGMRTVTDGTRGVLVRDPFGSYPVRSLLCSNAFWMTAVEYLVRRTDLTVLDLTGFSDQSKGTARELQLIIDRIPLHRVVLLKDLSSSGAYLIDHVRAVWARMAAGSPNATGSPAIALFASAENLIAPDATILAARGRSRRLAAAALDIAAGRLAAAERSYPLSR